jgi:hypothetical protein
MKILTEKQLNDKEFMKRHFDKKGLEKLKRAKREFLAKNEKCNAGKVAKLIQWGKKDGNIGNYAFLYAESQGVESAINVAYQGYLKRAN